MRYIKDLAEGNSIQGVYYLKQKNQTETKTGMCVPECSQRRRSRHRRLAGEVTHRSIFCIFCRNRMGKDHCGRPLSF